MARPPIRHLTRPAVLLVLGLATSAVSLPAQPAEVGATGCFFNSVWPFAVK